MLGQVTNKKTDRGAALIFIIVGLAAFTANFLLAEPQAAGESLRILDIKVDPIRQGINVVRVAVENAASADRLLAVSIQTRSPRFGRGLGWGTTFFETIEANVRRTARFVFKIPGPLTDDTTIRLRFAQPASRAAYDSKNFFQEAPYLAKDLARAISEPDVWDQVSKEETAQAESVFRRFQAAVAGKEYNRAWDLLSPDYRNAEFFGTIESFEKAMSGTPPFAFFFWESARLAGFKPEAAGRRGSAPILKAGDGNERWIFVFTSAPAGGSLLVAGIEGFTPRVVQQANWEERLLPKMATRRTEHFDVYFYPDSTAARDIDAISARREKGYLGISEFFGRGQESRIRLILFEDGRTKQFETGHQGMGWAFGETMVEVYNENDKLDPFHELVHILAGRLGDPPAAFSEGLAVQLSERLGAVALEHLGGGAVRVSERAAEIRRQGRWIGLEKLLTYSEIGSQESQPDTAYPEAAAFVGFLLDRFGKEKFLEAYRSLRNPTSPEMIEKNRHKFSAIFGRTPAQIEEEWLKSL